jgi:hypothetical protein
MALRKRLNVRRPRPPVGSNLCVLVPPTPQESIMKATLKSLAALVLAALATGCATLSLEGDGNGNTQPDTIVAQMEGDSRGK